MDCRNCSNKECFINKYCLPDWLGYIQYHKKSKLYASKRIIFSSGDPVFGIYVLCSGKTKITSKIINDKKRERTQIIRIAGNGQILGHRGINNDMVYPISAETLDESDITYITNTDFIKLVNSNRDFAYHMMMFYADELLKSEQKFIAYGTFSIEQKTGIALNSVLESFGYKSEDCNELNISLSFKELANFALISIPSLHKAFDMLTERRILKIDGEKVFLLDEEGLNNLINNNQTE